MEIISKKKPRKKLKSEESLLSLRQILSLMADCGPIDH